MTLTKMKKSLLASTTFRNVQKSPKCLSQLRCVSDQSRPVSITNKFFKFFTSAFVTRIVSNESINDKLPISWSSIRSKIVSVNEDTRLLHAHLQLLKAGQATVKRTEVRTAPIFTASVLKHEKEKLGPYGFFAGSSDILEKNLKQSSHEDPRIFYNISAPSSAFICGSQGSGKSHTLSCLLENCLMKSDLSHLDKPLAALVLHYDSFTSDSRGTPCEAAYLGSNPNIKVKILCSPANMESIKRTYAGLNVKIEPLRINQTDLNTKRMLDLMAVNSDDGSMPLYLHSISRILRELRTEQQKSNLPFNYSDFKRAVQQCTMLPGQIGPLNQRLDTLKSFMPKSQTDIQHKQQEDIQLKPNRESKKKKKKGSSPKTNIDLPNKFEENQKDLSGNDWSIQPGTVTIVDLSCPCVTSDAACALFNMCLSLFLEQPTKIGRIIALDEAHKYMNSSTEAMTLTSTLLSAIRLQRHLGTRIFISTQEPTISPTLLDLCSITIVHRFTSPNWLQCLRKHIAALDHNQAELESNEKPLSENSPPTNLVPFKINSKKDILQQIVKLDVGNALLFAPSAVVDVDQKLGMDYLKIKVRNRLTTDGGKSIMVE
ncbi:putative p-loop containing nucleoside triphosphate hydrolase [Erysiphe neolycopersici]|uniref:Putative p-loop containing nucleoside triphosphate hydrolase n=1 Tax=Erysiphe neolycopersici TaxID=212602 RepID=A0A420I2H2_9PEZI|nr:putative p-loop containing nucleoside triphosphate hydrolase [Erysiphe neolycopersici]